MDPENKGLFYRDLINRKESPLYSASPIFELYYEAEIKAFLAFAKDYVYITESIGGFIKNNFYEENKLINSLLAQEFKIELFNDVRLVELAGTYLAELCQAHEILHFPMDFL